MYREGAREPVLRLMQDLGWPGSGAALTYCCRDLRRNLGADADFVKGLLATLTPPGRSLHIFRNISEALKADIDIIELTAEGCTTARAVDKLLALIPASCPLSREPKVLALLDPNFILSSSASDRLPLFLPEDKSSILRYVSSKKKRCLNLLEAVSSDMMKDATFMRAFAEECSEPIADYGCHFGIICNNPDDAKWLVRARGMSLQWAPPCVRDDVETVLAAIARDASDLRFASIRLRRSREVVLKAIKSEEVNGTRTIPVIAWAIGGLTQEREVAIQAVKANGHSLLFTPKYRDDEEVVLEALRANGDSFKWVSCRLSSDRNMVRAAISSARSLFPIPKQYAYDREIMLQAIDKNGIALHLAPSYLRDDDEVVSRAVTSVGLSLMFASRRLQECRDVVMIAVSSNGLGLKFACKTLRRDPEVVLTAIRNDFRALLYADPDLQFSFLRETLASHARYYMQDRAIKG